MTSNESGHSSSSDEDDCPEKYVIFPKYNAAYMKSSDGILRTLQMISSLLSFIFIQVSVSCFYNEYNRKQVCEGPNIHVFRYFSAVSLVVFLSVVFIHLLHIYSINVVCPQLPWQKIVNTQNLYLNISCAISTFFAAAILAGSAQSYVLAIAAAVDINWIPLICWLFFKGIIYPGDKKAFQPPSSNSVNSGIQVEFNAINPEINDDNEIAPCLLSSMVRKTSDISFREKCQSTGSASLNDALDHRLSSSSSGSSQSEGRLEFLEVNENLKNSISEMSDKRSWIITNSLRGSDVTNSAADNMSNGTYTVEVEN